MATNKVVYYGTTLIDLTSDTVDAAHLAKGITAHDKSGTIITGESTLDSDTTDATVAVAEMLSGKTAYARGTKLTGTMPNIGSVTGSISSKTATYTIPQGYHDGSGSVGIASTEQAKLIGSNIRKGVSILGVEGAIEEESENPQTGVEVTPSASDQTITPASGYTCIREMVVKAVPYATSTNSAGGTTVTIG